MKGDEKNIIVAHPSHSDEKGGDKPIDKNLQLTSDIQDFDPFKDDKSSDVRVKDQDNPRL